MADYKRGTVTASRPKGFTSVMRNRDCLAPQRIHVRHGGSSRVQGRGNLRPLRAPACAPSVYHFARNCAPTYTLHAAVKISVLKSFLDAHFHP
jgi:hypothetical protein